MRVEEKVSVEFNLSNAQDLNDYKAFKNMRNVFQAMLKFKESLENIISPKEQSIIKFPPDDSLEVVKEKASSLAHDSSVRKNCAEEIKNIYIKILNEHGIEV